MHILLKQFEIFSHFSVDRVVTRDGTNIPFLAWPDGSPCFIGTLYMLSLCNRRGRGGRQGLSRRGSKGGSLGEYAAKLSQLLQKCYKAKIEVSEITDGQFSEFVSELRNEPSPRNSAQPKKSANVVIATGRVWLDFLVFTQSYLCIDNFVGPEGSIRAVEHKYSIRASDGRSISRSYLYHHSFGPEARFKRRNPISNGQITLLKGAIDSIGSSTFVEIRRHCLIELLQYTGARRGEIANLKVGDILLAFHEKNPMLRLETLKQGDNTYRHIPVTKLLLHRVKGFIEIHRRKLIKSKFPNKADNGFLFISETTGQKLSEETISNEILILKKHAGIEQQICAHMFRHAFITNLFALFIQRHHIENDDQLRKALLDSQTFLAEVTQWTGHISTASLEVYINLGFKAVSNYANTLTSVHLFKAMEIFDQHQLELIRRLEQGLSIHEYKIELARLIKLRDLDFETARTRQQTTELQPRA